MYFSRYGKNKSYQLVVIKDYLIHLHKTQRGDYLADMQKGNYHID